MISIKKTTLILSFFTLVGCISIPKETVTLSETIEKDIAELQRSHIKMVNIHFNDLKEKVNVFVDDVYAPFIINYVLKGELQAYQAGEISIYKSIMDAGESDDKEVTSKALQEMNDFVQAARAEIEKKRMELLQPIQEQEREITEAVNTSYYNALQANATLTAYLRSVQKVKDSQRRAISVLGLKGVDTKITNTLVNTSDQLSSLLEEAKKVDQKSDEAKEKIENISSKIKEILNKTE